LAFSTALLLVALLLRKMRGNPNACGISM
jgi:hypothetical protein